MPCVPFHALVSLGCVFFLALSRPSTVLSLEFLNLVAGSPRRPSIKATQPTARERVCEMLRCRVLGTPMAEA